MISAKGCLVNGSPPGHEWVVGWCPGGFFRGEVALGSTIELSNQILVR